MVLGHLVVSRDLQVVSYVLCLSLCSVVLGVAWGPDYQSPLGELELESIPRQLGRMACCSRLF